MDRSVKKKTNYSRFLLLWAGNMISQVGGGLTSFGLGVYIFNRTGSAAQMALVTLLGFLPTLLLSVPAGVLADLFDRRLLMMIGDGCSAIGILYILFCMNSGGAALWQICAGVFVSACFSALPEPAFKATITDLLTKEEYTKASGLTSLAGSARYLVSPVIAGLLLAAYDIRLLLIIDISTFFVTAAAAAAVRRGLGKQRNGDRESFAGSLRGFCSLADGPRTAFIFTAGQERNQSKKMIAGSDHAFHTALPDSKLFDEFFLFFLIHLGDFFFNCCRNHQHFGVFAVSNLLHLVEITNFRRIFSKIILGDIGCINHRFCRQKEPGIHNCFFFFCDFQRAARFPGFKVGEHSLAHFVLELRSLITAMQLALNLFLAALHRLHVSKNQFQVYSLNIADRV